MKYLFGTKCGRNAESLIPENEICDIYEDKGRSQIYVETRKGNIFYVLNSSRYKNLDDVYKVLSEEDSNLKKQIEELTEFKKRYEHLLLERESFLQGKFEFEQMKALTEK